MKTNIDITYTAYKNEYKIKRNLYDVLQELISVVYDEFY